MQHLPEAAFSAAKADIGGAVMSSSDITPTKSSRSRSSGFLLFSLLFLVASVQILFLFPQNACAVDVTLTWDANSEGDLAGYRVFYREEGQSYDYNEPGWEGSDTTCAISDLDENTTYYFVARAFDTSGNESGNSNEVSYQPSLPPSNLPPLSTVITSPYYGQTGCELLTHITTEPFSDPDGDLHVQSRWQISKQEDFSSLILDVTSTEHLTELTVPRTVLEPDTTYYVRVQFYDVYLEPSEWSDTIEFTTTSDANDLNADGIPDDQEVGYDVDLNGDGIADNDQPEVIKSMRSSVDNETIGVCKISDSINAIEAVEAIDPSTISDKIMSPQKFLLGLFSYRLSVNEPGAIVTVRIYFSKDISMAWTFYKYDTINGWQDYSEHTTFNDDSRSITLEVKDGGYGDSDGVANGVIVDPGGLAEAADVDEMSEGTELSGDDASIDMGCFIATAAFGSYAEPHVKLLRDFRDQCLLTNTPGRWFVRMYYRYGPFWADLINIHTWCKPVVRVALMPLVGASYVLIKASVATRIIGGLLLSLLVVGCFVRMHGRAVTGAEQL